MFHVDSNSLFVAVAFQVRGDLKPLAALRAAYRSTGLNGDDFGAMFGQQTTKRRPDDAGRKTENRMPANGNERAACLEMPRSASCHGEAFANSLVTAC